MPVFTCITCVCHVCSLCVCFTSLPGWRSYSCLHCGMCRTLWAGLDISLTQFFQLAGHKRFVFHALCPAHTRTPTCKHVHVWVIFCLNISSFQYFGETHLNFNVFSSQFLNESLLFLLFLLFAHKDVVILRQETLLKPRPHISPH